MEENKNISQIALEKIKESGIKPISKKIFDLKKVIFWSIVGLSIVFGTISFSVMLVILFNNDWYLYNKLGFGFIFKTLPYFWIIFLLIFIFLGEFVYRKTSFGYRHHVLIIIGIYMGTTIICGSMLYVVGIGEKIEESLSSNIPMYKGMMFNKNEFWNNAKDGFISGQIIFTDGKMVKIIDSNNNTWILNIDKTNVRGRTKIQEGEFVKIIGDIEEDNIFIPEDIRPWQGKKMR